MEDEVHDYRSELESGLINLVVSLCQEKAKYMPMEQAKAQVSSLLNDISTNLIQETEEENNE